MTTWTIPKEYGYVVALAAATCLLSFIHGLRVTTLRKKAGVRYPNAYASEESIAKAEGEAKLNKYIFNCTQRAHQNYLENMPVVLVGLLVGGSQYPRIAIVCGLGWLAFRVVYLLGYTRTDKKDGQGRLQGGMFWAFQFTLLGLVAKTAWNLVRAS